MIIAANFKTNFTRKKTQEYFDGLENYLHVNQVSQEVFVFPPSTSLFTHQGKSVMGAQNAYPTINGAFTGEIGTEQLGEFGIKTLLIGHSERRHVLGETQEFIAKKYTFYKELGYKIIYCIGESLEIRQKGESVMLEYINDQFAGIDTTYENLIIAYEPVWAIGTGLTPTLEDIEKLHTVLKLTCKTPILYGGSVKAENAKEILALENVDGILVGSGALNVNDFCSMIQDAQQLNK